MSNSAKTVRFCFKKNFGDGRNVKKLNTKLCDSHLTSITVTSNNNPDLPNKMPLLSIGDHNQKKQKPNNFLVFKFVYSNVRSYLNKISLLSNYITSNDLDLFFCSESWLKPYISDSIICPEGFSAVRSDRLKTRGGGCMVLHKISKDITIIETPTDAVFDILCIDVFVNTVRMRYICVYLPPMPNLDTVERLCNVMSNLLIYNTPTFIVA